MSMNQEGWTASDDIQKNKGIAAVAYILFFVPLLAAKESRFARFHANQGLLLLIACFAANLVLGLIPIIGWLIAPLANLVFFVFAVLGIIRAWNGESKELPLIGSIQLLK
ncbi:DUF4870 domain-containing protein [Paenibacillus sp. YYML68]|uniref:DUF4870 domain-containing protein n=1 Tax=Paenibacillus sp. YYML68 TaxID=2909250 RepID=UPI0024919CBE|nr:DUF4870 domain-containing protein [Paenibacillus sp. YYML68]